MMTNLLLLRNALLAIHLISAAIWVGGMAYALLVARPALNLLDPAAKAMQMHLLTLKKFFLIVWHVMPLMLISGWLMVFLAWGGMRDLPPNINAMQGLGVTMAGVFLYTYFLPYKRLQRAVRATPEMLGKVRIGVTINLVLGGLTIIAGSLGHVW
jgi:uncharacterized membrane protein